MSADVAGSGEGLPSRAERKRRRRRPVTVEHRAASKIVARVGNGRHARTLNVLWVLIVVVGGAIVAMVELNWRATGDPLQWCGAIAYGGMLAVVLGTSLVRRARVTGTVQAPAIEQEAERAVTCADQTGTQEPVVGEEGPDEDIPLTFDREKLTELRRAIAAAFPELAEEDDGDPAGETARACPADTARG